MNSLYDFVTHVKGVEYIVSVLFIAGYVLYSEVLKPKPFKTMVEAGREDMEFMRRDGYKDTIKTIGKVAAAPFIGLIYLITLPVLFGFAILSSAVSGAFTLVGKEAAFNWRPMEAYLTGKKKKKDEDKTEEEK